MVLDYNSVAIACSVLAALFSGASVLYVAVFSTPARLQKTVDTTHHIAMDGLARLEQLETRHASMKAEVNAYIDQLDKASETLESRRKAAAAKLSALNRKEKGENGTGEDFDITRLSKPQLRTLLRARRAQGA